MKIVSLVGSPRPVPKSNSTKAVLDIIGAITEKGMPVEHELIEVREQDVKMCIGCENCFYSGKCCFDDDMKKIQKKLLSADFIVFASPVYVHQITGRMKNIFDRLAFWTHFFPLAGKLGLTVSVSHNNGNTQVETYLKEIMMHLGIVPIHGVNLQFGNLTETGYVSYIKDAARRICNTIENREEVKIPEYMSNSYLYYFNKMLGLEKEGKTEFHDYKFWKENNYLDFNTFHELYKKLSQINMQK